MAEIDLSLSGFTWCVRNATQKPECLTGLSICSGLLQASNPLALPNSTNRIARAVRMTSKMLIPRLDR